MSITKFSNVKKKTFSDYSKGKGQDNPKTCEQRN